jgi:pimeloyl-ACP methyl ester carboxylesterase
MEGERFEVDRGDVALAGERWGDGEPRALLLHAGVCDRRSWRQVAGHLAADGLPVAAYDRRGFGETPLGEQPPSDLEDLVAVLDAIAPGPGIPVCLVGASMGGGLALDAALSFPERLAGLVLIAPAIGGSPEAPEEDYDAGTLRIDEAMTVADEDEDLARLNELEVELWLDGPAGPPGRVAGEARALALEMNAIALTNGAEGLPAEGIDAHSRIEEIALPATVAWGELDIPLMMEGWRRLAERLPAAGEPALIAGTAHLPFLERPDEVAALIAGAIGAVDTAG